MSRESKYATYGDLPNEEQDKDPATVFNLVKKLNGLDELAYIHNNFEIVIIMVSGTWCVPCKKTAPKFEQMAANTQGVKDIVFLYEDIDSENCCHKEICTNVPSFYIYHNGKLVKTLISDFTKLVATVDNMLNILSQRQQQQQQQPSVMKRY